MRFAYVAGLLCLAACAPTASPSPSSRAAYLAQYEAAHERARREPREMPSPASSAPPTLSREEQVAAVAAVEQRLAAEAEATRQKEKSDCDAGHEDRQRAIAAFDASQAAHDRLADQVRAICKLQEGRLVSRPQPPRPTVDVYSDGTVRLGDDSHPSVNVALTLWVCPKSAPATVRELANKASFDRRASLLRPVTDEERSVRERQAYCAGL